MLQGHVGLGLQADARTEDVRQRRALLGQGVDDGRARRGQRSLEHVAEYAQHAVEALVLGSPGSPPLDPRHHLGHQHKIDDQRGCEQ